LVLGISISVLIPGGSAAVIFCAVLAVLAAIPIKMMGIEKKFLLRLFFVGLLLRVLIGSLINGMALQEFFGGDAFTYDFFGNALWQSWSGDAVGRTTANEWSSNMATGWGMMYVVASIYAIVGRNMLAVQYFNAVLGALTAPVIFLCAQHIFSNLRVSRLAALSVALYPSLVLWSSQGLKDGPVVFLLALTMLATLKLGERLNGKYFVLLVLSLAALISMRFYIFYMAVVAVAGAFVIGMRPLTSTNLARQLSIVVGVGLVLTYVGVLRQATQQMDVLNLQTVQVSRADLATSAQSGFMRDVDVSTTSGALTAIPLGMVYLLFAPFPWQLANLRQLITLPEMLVWWAAFPALVLGVWFTLKFRLRQALPILIFTLMLTLAYSVFQGNVGTAYRQRSQILVFYFIFVAVGGVLLKEQQEDRRLSAALEKQAATEGYAPIYVANEKPQRWKDKPQESVKGVTRNLSERINF
jgi:hypothetical protein